MFSGVFLLIQDLYIVIQQCVIAEINQVVIYKLPIKKFFLERIRILFLLVLKQLIIICFKFCYFLYLKQVISHNTKYNIFVLGLTYEDTFFASWKPIRAQKEGTFECKNCSKRYIQKQTLNRHLQYECGKPPQFQCPWCHYCAKQKANLLTHLRNRHIPHLVQDPSSDLKPTADTNIPANKPV